MQKPAGGRKAGKILSRVLLKLVNVGYASLVGRKTEAFAAYVVKGEDPLSWLFSSFEIYSYVLCQSFTYVKRCSSPCLAWQVGSFVISTGQARVHKG